MHIKILSRKTFSAAPSKTRQDDEIFNDKKMCKD